MPIKYNVVKERRGSDKKGKVVASFDSQSKAEEDAKRRRDEYNFVVMPEEQAENIDPEK